MKERRRSASQPWSRGPEFLRNSGLLLDAGVSSVLRALVKAREHRIIDLLAFDQVYHDARRLISHFEWPLTDEGFHAAFLGQRHFFANRVRGNDDERLVIELFLVLIGQLTIGLRRTEQRPAAFNHNGVELRIGRQDVGYCLDAGRAIIIGKNRAARDFGPAAFTIQSLQALLAGESVTRTGGATQNVVGRGIALDKAYGAAVRFYLLHVLAEAEAHQIIV